MNCIICGKKKGHKRKCRVRDLNNLPPVKMFGSRLPVTEKDMNPFNRNGKPQPYGWMPAGNAAGAIVNKINLGGFVVIYKTAAVGFSDPVAFDKKVRGSKHDSVILDELSFYELLKQKTEAEKSGDDY